MCVYHLTTSHECQLSTGNCQCLLFFRWFPSYGCLISKLNWDWNRFQVDFHTQTPHFMHSHPTATEFRGKLDKIGVYLVGWWKSRLSFLSKWTQDMDQLWLTMWKFDNKCTKCGLNYVDSPECGFFRNERATKPTETHRPSYVLTQLRQGI